MLEGKDRAQGFELTFSIKSVRPVLRCPHPHHCPSAANETVPVCLLMLMSCKVAKAREGIKSLKREENELCLCWATEQSCGKVGLQVPIFAIIVCLFFLYRVSRFPLVSGWPGLSLLSLWDGHD